MQLIKTKGPSSQIGKFLLSYKVTNNKKKTLWMKMKRFHHLYFFLEWMRNTFFWDKLNSLKKKKNYLSEVDYQEN